MSGNSHDLTARESSDESIQQTHAALSARKPEPKQGFSMLPLFFLGLVSTMIFFVSIYFLHNSSKFDPMVQDARFDPSKAGAVVVAKVDPVIAGKKLYSAAGQCITCHQESGKGVPGAFPPLAGSEWVVGSEERLVRILLHGLNGPVKVSGSDFNGAMPAFGAGSGYNYSDEKIAQVLTYIRQEWGNGAPAISAERVTEIRTKGAAGRSSPWTAAELEAIP